MSNLVFQLVFATLAVALVAAALIVRRRRAAARPPEMLPEEQPEAEAPVRRRQFQSFVAQEQQAEATEVPPAVPEAATQPLPEPANESGLSPESDLSPEPDLSEAVMGRLEAAFEALQAGEITLGAYRERIEAEEAVLDRRIAALGSRAGEPELDAALAARESVRWCLGWADEQAGSVSG